MNTPGMGQSPINSGNPAVGPGPSAGAVGQHPGANGYGNAAGPGTAGSVAAHKQNPSQGGIGNGFGSLMDTATFGYDEQEWYQ